MTFERTICHMLHSSPFGACEVQVGLCGLVWSCQRDGRRLSQLREVALPARHICDKNKFEVMTMGEHVKPASILHMLSYQLMHTLEVLLKQHNNGHAACTSRGNYCWQQLEMRQSGNTLRDRRRSHNASRKSFDCKFACACLMLASALSLSS